MLETKGMEIGALTLLGHPVLLTQRDCRLQALAKNLSDAHKKEKDTVIQLHSSANISCCQ